MSHDVFVSYSQPDSACAFELVAALEGSHISTWIAPRDITPAADWAAEIVSAISAARLMVLVFSERCNSSPQVCREVERAVHRQVPVLPLRIEPALPTRSLEYFLSTQHWFDAYPPPRAPHYERLLTHIRCRLEQPRMSGEPTARTTRDLPALGSAASAGVDVGATGSRAALLLGPAELATLERQLADHIGPVARLLIQRALREARDRGELATRLANEIDSPSARQRFLADCRTGLGA